MFNKERYSVSVLFMLFGFGFSTWASRIPHIQQKLGLSDPELGLFLFAIPAGDILTMPLTGWLTAKYGTSRLTLPGISFYAGVLILLGMAGNKYQLLPFMMLMGSASNLVNICINTQSVLVQKLYTKSVIGSFHGLWSFAGFGGALGGLLMTAWAVSPALHFAASGLLILVLAWIFNSGLIADTVEKGKDSGKFAWPDRTLLLLGLLALACMTSEGTMFDWSGIYFRKVVRPGKELEGTGYAVFMGCMATGRFISDALITRIGRKKTLQLGGLLIASGTLISVLFPYFGPATAGFVLIGFGVAPIIPVIYTAAGNSPGYPPPVALAIVTTIGFIGFLC